MLSPLLATLTVLAAAPLKLAIMPVAAGEGVGEKTAAAIAEAVVAEVRRMPGVQAITPREIASLLSLEQQKVILGCASEACVADIGGALGVDQAVLGDVAVLGTSWLFHLKLFDARKGRVLAQSDRRLKGGSIDDLLDALPAMGRELFGAQGAGGPAPGTLPAAPAAASALPLPARWADEPLELPAEVRRKLRVWRGEQGLLVATVPFDIGSPVLAGDASGLYQVAVYSGGASLSDGTFERSFWEPRAGADSSSISFRDGRLTLFCGRKAIALAPLADAEAEPLLGKARLLRPRWRRRAAALARTDTGTYFYVDDSRAVDRDREPAPDPRLYTGPKGRLAPLELVDAISDPGGQVYLTAQGRLRIARGPGRDETRAEWIPERGAPTPLVWLPADGSRALIYGALGVYRGERLGTPCDGALASP